MVKFVVMPPHDVDVDVDVDVDCLEDPGELEPEAEPGEEDQLLRRVQEHCYKSQPPGDTDGIGRVGRWKNERMGG